VPSVHPRCNQHGLVAPDGMCVLCRKQTSSAPPSQPLDLKPSLPLRAAEALSGSTDKCAALLLFVALATMATTYMLDTTKARELAAAQAQLQHSASEQRQAETERMQALLLAANEIEDTAIEHSAAELDAVPQQGDEPDRE
jgi:hypothetical protein